ncbi:MAG: DUF5946 family protein [Chloroflexota bacterium]|nr:DUF5946 family protein [Chloroflexota bacterium]
MIQTICPDCGAMWKADDTCETHFHTLLAWEWDYRMYDLHHLLVLCYHLQHPHLYSPQTLANGLTMLVDFVEHGMTPQQMRKEITGAVDSGVRAHKITGTPDSYGTYAAPITWTMTIADVVAGGPDQYYAGVGAWAESMLARLRAAGAVVT